jgi:glucosylceramidase
MKDSNDMMGGGVLLPEYRDTWANYFVRWIQAYQKQGVGVWGITVQNEPENAASWESCIFTAEETRDFVSDHLAPALDKGGLSDVKIFGFDHNKDHVSDWADVLLGDDSKSKDDVDGIAFHWYSGSCFANVQKVFDAHSDKTLLPSEACYELTVLQDDDQTEEGWLVNGTWAKGEGYGREASAECERSERQEGASEASATMA